MRTKCLWVSVVFLVLALTGCGAEFTSLGTTIAPLASEDIAGPCRYDVIDNSTEVQKGVLVLFERGDTNVLYQDDSFRQAMKALHFAIVWAHQCPSRSLNDLQPDATKGQTRMLFAALSNLATITNHPELATAGVVLYGFSAAGVLTATMANDHPERLWGTIQYAAGAADLDLDNIPVSTPAAAIPTLVLANAQDKASGTSRSYRYFQRGRVLGASWAYAVQNATAHCCNLSTRAVILPWIQAVAATHDPVADADRGMRPAAATGAMSHFVCSPDGVKDGQGEINCNFTTAHLGAQSPSALREIDGWLPNTASAAAWLTWVTNTSTN